MYRTLFYVNICGSYKLLKTVRLFGPPCTITTATTTTLCLKNDTDVAHNYFDIDQPILIIFDRDVIERLCYQTVICYSTSPN